MESSVDATAMRPAESAPGTHSQGSRLTSLVGHGLPLANLCDKEAPVAFLSLSFAFPARIWRSGDAILEGNDATRQSYTEGRCSAGKPSDLLSAISARFLRGKGVKPRIVPAIVSDRA